MVSGSGWHPVCRLDELAAGSARGFDPDGYGDDRAFVVRDDHGIYAYANRCPHNLRPLEYAKDRFLNARGSEIICYAHGAHFNIVDGRCTFGPCLGQTLPSLPILIEEGMILVRLEH